MSYTYFLARKISLSQKGKGGTPAVKVAIVAVALSVAIMLIAIAIVLGFKREIRNKVLGFNSHITLYATSENEDGNNLINLTPSLIQVLDSTSFITEYSLEASIPAILKTSDNFKGVYLKSVGGGNLSQFLRNNLEEGKIPDYSDENNKQKIVVSRLAANQLGLKLGDRIDTYFMSGNIRMRKLEIAGIFNTHFDSYDNLFIYGSLPLIQQVGEIKPNQGTSIAILTDDFDRLEQNTVSLNNTLLTALQTGLLYRIYKGENALSKGAGYFNWLNLLDTNVVVILILMTIVACATLISGLLIIILDKKRFISLLRAMGTPLSGVRRIFIYLALKIAIAGMIIGNIITLAFLFVQERWHILHLDADSYYIDFVPVEISLPSIILLNAATLVIIYLCLILPSSFAARISPAESLKTE